MTFPTPLFGKPRQCSISGQPAGKAAPLLALTVGLTLAAMPALAHEGHDAPAAPASRGASPTFEAHSDLFEVVGRLQTAADGHGEPRLTLWLDRWASGEPVAGASIEIEASQANGDKGGKDGAPLKAQAEARPDGTYALPTAFARALAAPGEYALTLTVTAGDQADLLAADFDVAADAVPAAASPWAARLGIAAATLALAALLAFAARRLRRRAPRSGSAS
ncbi:hypothetical protein [Oryzomicrobium sp.]|uniref:hypothetical protein n=1 Tax=Oryzomicrobium sp. TaxID=1911578 RepID=UPI002FE2CC69